MLLMLHCLTNVYLHKVRELKLSKETGSNPESKIFRLLRSVRFFFPKKISGRMAGRFNGNRIGDGG